MREEEKLLENYMKKEIVERKKSKQHKTKQRIEAFMSRVVA